MAQLNLYVSDQLAARLKAEVRQAKLPLSFEVACKCLAEGHGITITSHADSFRSGAGGFRR